MIESMLFFAVAVLIVETAMEWQTADLQRRYTETECLLREMNHRIKQFPQKTHDPFPGETRRIWRWQIGGCGEGWFVYRDGLDGTEPYPDKVGQYLGQWWPLDLNDIRRDYATADFMLLPLN